LAIQDPAEIVSVFERVLSAPEFRRPVRLGFLEWFASSPLGRGIAWLWERFLDLLELVFPSLTTSQERTVSVVAFVVLSALVILLIWRRVSRSGWIGEERRGAGGSHGSAPVSSSGWARWARERAAAGDLRGASTGVYQAVILHLDSQGAVRFHEWKTPGDYADEVADSESLGRPFRVFLSRFVEIAFGPGRPTVESWQRLEAGARGLGCPL